MNRTSSRGERGFSLVELLVALAITTIVMTIVLVSLDANSRVTRLQMDIGDLQQSTRMSHRGMTFLARMAGRGGLPRPLAVLVQQNVPVDTVVAGEPVEPGTDILTLRGAFTTPIYRVDSEDPAAFAITGSTAQLRIDSVTRTGFAQSLDSLESLVNQAGEVPREAVTLVSRQGDSVYAVVELAAITFEDLVLDVQNAPRPVRRATLTFNIAPDSGEHTMQYLPLSAGGAFPANLTSVLFASVLQEYRYYVRTDFAVPGDASSPPRPKLCRAHMYPATELVHAGDAAEAAVEIAEMADLQIAFGIDRDGDGFVDERDDDGVLLSSSLDEWQYNDPSDEDDLAWGTAPLHYIRLTTLGNTRSPDRQYISPAIESIENRVYDEGLPATADETLSRRYRRRTLQSVIDVRNL